MAEERPKARGVLSKIIGRVKKEGLKENGAGGAPICTDRRGLEDRRLRHAKELVQKKGGNRIQASLPSKRKKEIGRQETGKGVFVNRAQVKCKSIIDEQIFRREGFGGFSKAAII